MERERIATEYQEKTNDIKPQKVDSVHPYVEFSEKRFVTPPSHPNLINIT